MKTSQNIAVDMIIVQTENGLLPRYVAKYRPSVPILACSQNEQVIRQLSTSRGIIGLKVLATDDRQPETLIQQAISYCKDNELCKAGRKVLYLHGMTENPSEFDEIAMKELIDVPSD